MGAGGVVSMSQGSMPPVAGALGGAGGIPRQASARRRREVVYGGVDGPPKGLLCPAAAPWLSAEAVNDVFAHHFPSRSRWPRSMGSLFH